jgi:hypothetical protein
LPAFFPIFRREKIKFFRGAEGRTDIRGMGQGSPTGVAIRKDEELNLPRMGATDASIIRITGGNFTTRRHVNRLIAIINTRAIVNFVRVKRHVEEGTIALQGVGGGGAKFERVYVYKCTAESLRVYSCSNQLLQL